MFRRSLKHISDPVSRLLLRTVSISDPWERSEDNVPNILYGLGARHDFSWYLEGESNLSLSSFDEIIGWLSNCKYSSDSDTFHEDDFWQHPCTFEKLQEGDCEDYALWAWRKLIQLGYPAEFVAGRTRLLDCPADQKPWSSAHTWVHFDKDGQRMLFDAAGRHPDIVIKPLDEISHAYLPEVSVDENLKRYVYGGFYLLQKGGNDF